MPFDFIPQKIKDVILVCPKVFKDNRGVFLESYNVFEFKKNGINVDFIQDNCARSKARVLRGLHYQKSPFDQAKLICCTKGKILDIAVDLRADSPSFKQYVKLELSEDNNYQLFIPEGFAHGYVVLSDEACISYKVNKNYEPNFETGIIWNDKTLNIDWDIDFEPILSEKDKKLPFFEEVDL